MSSIDLVILGIVLENRKAPMTFKRMWSTTIFPLDKNKRTFYLSQGSPVERKGLSAKRYCQGR